MERTFICYLDDNNQRVEAFVDLIEVNSVLVKFSTNRNIVTIPFTRVLKIKEQKEVSQDDNEE